jgi:hypothetical protein|eukprot:30736-Pelagococcus_subviridis.AAC.1
MKRICVAVRVEVFRVTCGSERVRDGRASDAVPDVGYERDGDVARDASFPVAFGGWVVFPTFSDTSEEFEPRSTDRKF